MYLFILKFDYTIMLCKLIVKSFSLNNNFAFSIFVTIENIIASCV